MPWGFMKSPSKRSECGTLGIPKCKVLEEGILIEEEC
jgi:hypothetical protein